MPQGCHKVRHPDVRHGHPLRKSVETTPERGSVRILAEPDVKALRCGVLGIDSMEAVELLCDKRP